MKALMPSLFEDTLFYAPNAGDAPSQGAEIMPTKIWPRSITIRRAEGRIDECIEATLSVPAKWPAQDFDLVTQANRLLAAWATTAPKGGCYDKCDFTVIFDDGEEYQGRYDLQHTDHAPADLVEHMTSHLRFYAGLYCPSHMTEAQYRTFLTQTEASSPGQAQECADYLAKYHIGTFDE